MYYVKWYRALNGVQCPYMTECDGACSPWDRLAKAKAFASKDEVVEYIKKQRCSHWLELTTIVFIHPLNFEERCKRDI